MTDGRLAVYNGTGRGRLEYPMDALCDFEIPSESPIETYQATLMDLLDGENSCACKPLDGNFPIYFFFLFNTLPHYAVIDDDGERRRLVSFENEESKKFKSESKNSRRKKEECPVRMPCDT